MNQKKLVENYLFDNNLTNWEIYLNDYNEIVIFENNKKKSRGRKIIFYNCASCDMEFVKLGNTQVCSIICKKLMTKSKWKRNYRKTITKCIRK